MTQGAPHALLQNIWYIVDAGQMSLSFMFHRTASSAVCSLLWGYWVLGWGHKGETYEFSKAHRFVHCGGMPTSFARCSSCHRHIQYAECVTAFSTKMEPLIQLLFICLLVSVLFLLVLVPFHCIFVYLLCFVLFLLVVSDQQLNFVLLLYFHFSFSFLFCSCWVIILVGIALSTHYHWWGWRFPFCTTIPSRAWTPNQIPSRLGMLLPWFAGHPDRYATTRW